MLKIYRIYLCVPASLREKQTEIGVKKYEALREFLGVPILSQAPTYRKSRFFEPIGNLAPRFLRLPIGKKTATPRDEGARVDTLITYQTNIAKRGIAFLRCCRRTSGYFLILPRSSLPRERKWLACVFLDAGRFGSGYSE